MEREHGPTLGRALDREAVQAESDSLPNPGWAASEAGFNYLLGTAAVPLCFTTVMHHELAAPNDVGKNRTWSCGDGWHKHNFHNSLFWSTGFVIVADHEYKHPKPIALQNAKGNFSIGLGLPNFHAHTYIMPADVRGAQARAHLLLRSPTS